MSAGPFITTRYQATNGDIHPIRVQEETEDAIIDGVTNDPPTGSVTNRIRAKVSKNKGEYGISPTIITVRFTAPPPTGYSQNQTYRIPALTPAFAAAAADSATGTYLSTAIVVVSTISEDVN